MKRIGLFSFLLIVCLLLCSASGTNAQEDVSVCKLAGQLEEYDGKIVIISGSITSYNFTNDNLVPATSFNVIDGKCKVRVLADDNLGFGNGDRVRVLGQVGAGITNAIRAINVQRIK